MDPFAFNPLFCSAKPGEVVNLNMKTACKLQSHLRAKGNQGLEREKELGCPPPVLQIPSSFHLREKHGAETHTDVHNWATCCSPSGCGRLKKKADEHTYEQTRKGTQPSTHTWSHQGNIITVTVHRGSSKGSLSIYCGVSSSLFLFSSFRAQSLSLLSLSHTHTHMIEGHR